MISKRRWRRVLVETSGRIGACVRVIAAEREGGKQEGRVEWDGFESSVYSV